MLHALQIRPDGSWVSRCHTSGMLGSADYEFHFITLPIPHLQKCFWEVCKNEGTKPHSYLFGGCISQSHLSSLENGDEWMRLFSLFKKGNYVVTEIRWKIDCVNDITYHTSYCALKNLLVALCVWRTLWNLILRCVLNIGNFNWNI